MSTSKHYLLKTLLAALALVASISAFAQNMIRGTVTDEAGQPVIGAAVIVEGTTKGVVTDENGNYSISATSGDVLEISCIGYKDALETVRKSTVINVSLAEDTKSLDEVVVIGYGATTRKNLTTAIATVKPDQIEKAAISNVAGVLLGRAAGVEGTINNAQPDGKINISIRGGGTPVYVVDGVVMPSSALENEAFATNKLPSSIDRAGLAGLNPEDIESVEILKDASAAIYGIGASDGVILITTKKGKAGRPTVSYSGSGSFVAPRNTVTTLNANEYMKAANAAGKEKYLYNNNMVPYGTTEYDGKYVPFFTEEAIKANTVNTNWTDLVLQNGYINNQNVTVQGGSNKVKYYLGLNYFDQKGVVKNSGMKRFVVHTNVDAELLPFVKLRANLNYNNNTYRNSTVGGETDNSQAAGAYYASILYPPILSQYDENGDWSQFGVIPNPQSLLEIDDQTKKDAINANFNLKIDIIKNWLSVNGTYGLNRDIVERGYYIPSYVLFNQILKSRGQISNSKRNYQTFEATLDFSHKFGDVVKVDAVLGMGKYLTDYFMDYSYFEDGNDNIKLDNISLATGTKNIYSSKAGSEKRSQFLRATVDVLDRYVITATVRRDGTDKFFPTKKYGIFPSVSLAWKMSNEKWLKDVKWINLLKIRASYGSTGRDNLGTTLYGVYKTYGSNISYNNQTGVGNLYTPYVLSGLDYENVTWEKTVMKNIGIDFAVLNDRLWGSFDVYRNDETNQLSYANSSWLDMFTTYPINSGHYKRVGWELSLNSKNIITKDFLWTTSLNLSHNNTTWVQRVDNYDYKAYQLDADGNVIPNEPVYATYLYESAGIINSSCSNIPESQKSLDASWQKPGVVIIKDQNGDNVIDKNDIVRRNYNDPKLYVGFGNTFTWKNWDLDIYLYGRFGYYRYNYAYDTGNPLNIADNQRNLCTSYYDFYNSETNPNSTQFGIAYSKTSNLPEGVGTDVRYQDASFVRVRNITLGYTFNLSKVAFFKGYLNSIRVYFDAQNPFLFTKFSYADPEITLGNSHSSVGHPQTKTFTGGVKINF